ncbi:MAG TPA: hypothetical protein VEY30_02200, partial [Myxococcaceae bacterium]|nr:hypothetical protein [Myxococcaceae bacterium]
MRRALATGLGYAALLAGVALRFDPGSALGTWNSDAAIPVLQSNDPDFDAFRLYYFGQDRFGAWPWLASQAVRALTGFVWTPWRAFLLQAAWACLGAVALCGLHRRAGPVLGATYAALALGSPLLPQELFGLGQPYGWQLTALFFGWGAGKRWLEAMDDLRPPRTVALWGGAAVFWAVLACWTSPVSVPLLLLGGWAEAARLGWLAPARQFRVRWAIWASVPAAVGYAVERELRHLFHRFSLKQFGHAYPTEVRLDVGHLKDNFVAVAAQLGAHPLAPLAGFGVGAALVSAGALAVVRRRGRVSLEVLPAVEAAVTSVSLAAAGLANAAIATAVRHTRMNNYALRYFTPTLVLLTLAAAAGLWALVEWRLRAARREVASWLTAGALLSGA